MILSIDSASVTASAALTDGENVIKSEFINAGLTHSETLLPMIKRVMQGYDFKELDAIAITAGPGSRQLRISILIKMLLYALLWMQGVCSFIMHCSESKTVL